jgi:hypothetical protein
MTTTATQLYRVIVTTTTGFVDPKVDTSIEWEGSDTDALSREYPPSNIMFADPFDQKEIEGGFIITRFTFERQLEDGSWEQIDDPRRRLTPISAHERAIDAENRRDFPGDYITEDDYGYYDEPAYDEVDDEPQYDCIYCADYGCGHCKPMCFDCGTEPVAKQGDTCSSCEAYYAELDKQYACCWCRDAPQEVGELCKSCNQKAIEVNREYMPYFGRIWKVYYWCKYRVIRLGKWARKVITSS